MLSKAVHSVNDEHKGPPCVLLVLCCSFLKRTGCPARRARSCLWLRMVGQPSKHKRGHQALQQPHTSFADTKATVHTVVCAAALPYQNKFRNWCNASDRKQHFLWMYPQVTLSRIAIYKNIYRFCKVNIKGQKTCTHLLKVMRGESSLCTGSAPMRPTSWFSMPMCSWKLKSRAAPKALPKSLGCGST